MNPEPFFMKWSHVNAFQLLLKSCYVAEAIASQLECIPIKMLYYYYYYDYEEL